MKTGVANLPLHYGSAPAWLFNRMKLMAREIILIILQEQGSREFLKKLADPFWFQSFACVLGFDWHSSGSSTVACGALKEGLKNLEKDTGLFICGGKGKTSRKTPDEIVRLADRYSLVANRLTYASKMSAKVDNTALLDGYQLYHHTFIFTKKGDWAVVQQGMNGQSRFARRYHWLNLEEEPENFSFIQEPHSGISAQRKEKQVLDLTAKKSKEARKVCAQVAGDKPKKNLNYFKKITELNLSPHHEVKNIKPENLNRILLKTYEQQPKNFQKLLEIKGVGPRAVRALSLISELIYGQKPSFEDPAKFSFAHGGKDGYPYPINKKHYDQSIEALKGAVKKAKIGQRDKLLALRRLSYGN